MLALSQSEALTLSFTAFGFAFDLPLLRNRIATSATAKIATVIR